MKGYSGNFKRAAVSDRDAADEAFRPEGVVITDDILHVSLQFNLRKCRRTHASLSVR